MFDLFLEGIESIKLACSLILLIPALGIAFLGKRRVWLVPAWIITVSVVFWARFTALFDVLPSGVLHIASGVALGLLAVVALAKNKLQTDVAATVGVAFVAAWTWQPCVGAELGDQILNRIRDTPPIGLLTPTLVYLTGLFVPLILLAALDVAWPKLGDRLDKPAVRKTGLGVVFLVGALVAGTLFDDLASELLRHSTPIGV